VSPFFVRFSVAPAHSRLPSNGMTARIVSLARDAQHRFSKQAEQQLELLEGLGVAGDAHCGSTVQHRSRVAVDPKQPNLRQVHLLHTELLDALAAEGFAVAPGDLGENITTSSIPLLELPTGTRLRIGASVVVELTGLRNPCRQIEKFRPGLLARLARKGPGGIMERLAGVMSVVVTGGEVAVGDFIVIDLPAGPHQPLAPV